MKVFRVAVIMTCDDSAEAIPPSPNFQKKYQILWASAWFYSFFVCLFVYF